MEDDERSNEDEDEVDEEENDEDDDVASRLGQTLICLLVSKPNGFGFDTFPFHIFIKCLLVLSGMRNRYFTGFL